VLLLRCDPHKQKLNRESDDSSKRPSHQAADKLEAAADLFPSVWNIPYNLACYACQLGKHEEAWEWLEDTFDLGNSKTVKLMALEDPDLEPFWAEIGEI
jgi:hypothetical protein